MFSSQAPHNWILLKLYGGEATTHTTNNKNFRIAQSNGTPRPAYTGVNFYELYNKTSQVNNVTLYVTSDTIWVGRLGNQMFIYASLLGISRTQGRRMFIEPKTSLEKTFKISYVAANQNTKQ